MVKQQERPSFRIRFLLPWLLGLGSPSRKVRHHPRRHLQGPFNGSIARFAVTNRALIWLIFSSILQDVHAFCEAPTLAEQVKIWETKLRPVILSKWITKLFLSNPAFLWNALGVPTNQAQVFLSETTTEQFAIDTLDPVAYGTHIKTGAYHYKVCLEQKYSPESWYVLDLPRSRAFGRADV